MASPYSNGKFHIEDEKGRNLTGTVTVPNTGSWNTSGTVNASATAVLSSGAHVLKWVQESDGFDLLSITVSDAAASTASAKFIRTDTATHGTWKNTYGNDGYTIVNDTSAPAKQPSYGSMSGNGWKYSWANPTSDTRALQKAGNGDRIAAQMGGDPYDVDCNLTDANWHQVALYALDWDRNGRQQIIEARDAASGNVLDTQILNSFNDGVYYIWNVKGHVVFHVINKSASNTALGGFFLDPVSSAPVAGNGTGLKGQYYAGTAFNTLVQTRVDPQINFNWGSASPMGSVGPNNWTARWTGQLMPRYNETYIFTTTTDDGLRLWVNDQLLIDKWFGQGATPWSGTIALNAGQKYNLKMEYVQYTGNASAKLEWQSASQTREVVPKSQLFPVP